LGFKNPIGQELTSPWHPGEFLTIIGVVKDFNIESLHKKIEPMALELMPENSTGGGYITVRISNHENIRETIQYIESTWVRHSNGKLFESFFFDADYENLYRSEIVTGKVLAVFTTLSIFIACLGLVALLTFTASIRRKEIGIRKILGASMGRLVNLLSAEIVKLIVIATVVAWPLAYVGAKFWLQSFVDQTAIDPWIYVAATLVVALICGLAMSFQIVKAATENPVHALKE
jgi:putative ABC transport system permease protein